MWMTTANPSFRSQHTIIVAQTLQWRTRASKLTVALELSKKLKGIGLVQDVKPIIQHLWFLHFWFKRILAWFSCIIISAEAGLGPAFTRDLCPYVYHKSRDVSCVQMGSEFYRLTSLRQGIVKNHFISFGRMTCLQYLRSLSYTYICNAFLNSKGYNCRAGGQQTFTGEGKQLQKWIIFFALSFLPRQRRIVLREIYFHNQYVPKLYLNHFTLYYIFNNYTMCCPST